MLVDQVISTCGRLPTMISDISSPSGRFWLGNSGTSFCIPEDDANGGTTTLGF